MRILCLVCNTHTIRIDNYFIDPRLGNYFVTAAVHPQE